ncbi:MAG: hypothetical protein AAGI53_08805 [Planctomycetota bacterium]
MQRWTSGSEVFTLILCLLVPTLVSCSAPRPKPQAQPSPNFVLSESEWTFHSRPGTLVETPNFRLHTTLRHGLLRDRFPRFAEYAMIHYSSYLTALPMPEQPLRTFVLANRQQWAELTQRLTGTAAQTFLQIERGGFAFNSQAVYWDIGPHDTLQIAAHEGWHQYTQAVFNVPLPVWLEEGLATYFAGFTWDPNSPANNPRPIFRPWSNPERFDTLRTIASQGRLVPLQDLLNSRPQDLIRTSSDSTLGYYAQVWALAHFLAEGADGRYRPELQRLLREHASGKALETLLDALGPENARRSLAARRGPGVFASYFNADIAEADAQYRAFVTRITRPGARQFMVQGKSPL